MAEEFVEPKEGAAEFYYNKLLKSTNPAIELSHLYRLLLGDGGRTIVTDIKSFNRLLQVYSRFNIYFSILELEGASGLDLSNFPYGLIAFQCRKRLEKRDEEAVSLKNLEKEVERRRKEIEKIKKITVKARKID